MPIPNFHSFPQPPPVLFSPSKAFIRVVPLVLLLMNHVPTARRSSPIPPIPRFCHDPLHVNSPVPHCELYTRNCCRASVNSCPIDLEVSLAPRIYYQHFGVRMALSLLEQMGSPTGELGGFTDPEIGSFPYPPGPYPISTYCAIS